VIEALMIIPMTLLFLIYVVQVLLYLTVELAIDDAMENYALCAVQAKTHCRSGFEHELKYLPLTQTRFHFNQQGITYKIDLETQALKIFHIQKTRQLSYDTKI
jgi:hypothetical protein